MSTGLYNKSKVIAIVEVEPMREGEYPLYFKVGVDEVDEIIYREENFGTYGLTWFDIYKDEELFYSMASKSVGGIWYEQWN